MNFRRFMIEGATLVIAAILLALAANAIAGSERKVRLAASEQPQRARGDETIPPPSSSIIEDERESFTDTSDTEATSPESPAVNMQSPASTTSKASREQVLTKFPPSPEVPAEEIHTDDAVWLWNNGALFLDARRTSVYHEGHIPGAKSFAVWEADVEDKVKALATEGLDPDMPVVIYCSGGECEDSHILAQKLWGMFFNNLRVYHEGFPGWTGAGNPINRGAQP